MNAPLVLKLSEKGTWPSSLVGGKARNLARLAEAGMSIPVGFCVTTEAYRSFVSRNGLDLVITESLRNIQDGGTSARETASERIHQAFLCGILSSEVVATVRKHYGELSCSNEKEFCVAVRSSATAEDLTDASFAGTQRTVLNVRGLPAILDALRNCWASLWTQRVLTYRSRMRITDTDLAIAVIVDRKSVV